MATWLNFNSQDSISPLMEQLTFFHDHTLMILAIIVTMVTYIMISMMVNKYINRYLLEGQTIELIWTMAPAMTLIFIALPSLQLLYLMDEINSPEITIKSIGHQWFWSYELSDFKEIEFDSYMIPENEQTNSSFRLLDVDNRLALPYNAMTRMIVSSTDVIHSWTIPSAGVKIDATPGRLNQTTFYINRSGIHFGQCSEICGTNHSFMPIVVESISPKHFIQWVKSL
uniref:Cytochrome c oxidase subunit 2 n=1 Tax=Bicellonychia lividipennis TaxID=1176499 RepID=A0A158V7Q0_9COLE|nr:cytochrome c oxidase subunit II [Bicellonychia lividipennis]AIQ80137.1 cytochrome c oxidase subunit II [Bicellonychia lividipennis]